jgi:WD40 repeat protein
LVRHLPGQFLGFSPSGAEYATANSNLLQVWGCGDSETNPVATFRLPPNAAVNVLKLSPDGRFVGCMNVGFDILVLEARTGKLLANAAEQAKPSSHGEFILEEFLPRSHRLAIAMESHSAIWDWQAPTNSRWSALPGNFLGASADGRWIVLNDDSRRRLKLVDSAASLKTSIELEGHTDSVVSVAFSHDGQRLASRDSRKEIRLWKLPEGQLVGIVPHRENGLGELAFSTDDQRLYIGGRSGVQVLEAPRHEPIVSQTSIPKPSAAEVPAGSIWSR